MSSKSISPNTSKPMNRPTQTTAQDIEQKLNEIATKYGLILAEKTNKGIEIWRTTYSPEWDVAEMFKDLKFFAMHKGCVVEVYSLVNLSALGDLYTISASITPSGIIRFNLFLGRRFGGKFWNSIEIMPERYLVFKQLVSELEKILAKLGYIKQEQTQAQSTQQST